LAVCVIMANRSHLSFLRGPLSGAVALLVALSLGGCASSRNRIPAGTTQPDKFLFEKGTEMLNKRKWVTSREYFRQLLDSYPQSVFRPDAKLGLGDAYLGEGSAESLVLAINEYREFLTFYPTNRRADYAQYKLGLCHFRQMAKPERDQTQTNDAVAEFETFVQRYPDSPLMPEARARLREAKDRVDESSYRVGLFYYRSRWYPGAIERFKKLLGDDPEYTGRDAVYFYLGEALIKINRKAEALPYFDRLVKEFEKSEYLARARKRVEELKAPAAPIR
jgi:outer membrane protein assembly factor BamD